MEWLIRILTVCAVLIACEIILFSKAGMRGISYTRRFSSRYSYVGDEVFLLEVLTNNRPLPLPLLSVESKIDPALEILSSQELEANKANYHKSLFSLLPFSKISRRHRIRLTRRGMYEIKSVALTAHDLFGFVKTNENEYSVGAIITVYPDFVDDALLKLPEHSLSGDITVKRWIIEDPFLLAGSRDYTGREPMKQINWSASARAGTLQVNRFDYTADTRLYILFNVSEDENQWCDAGESELLEYGLSLCATYARRGVENGLEVGLFTNGTLSGSDSSLTQIPPGSGEEHLYTLLEALARQTFHRTATFHYALELLERSGLSDSDLLLVTAYVDEEMESRIRLLCAKGNTVEIVKLERRCNTDEATA